MTSHTRALFLGRITALVVMVLGLPVVLGGAAFFTEAPVVAGEPAPRTVIAAEQVRVVDEEETDLQRRLAAEAVEEVVAPDLEARRALVQTVADRFVQIANQRQDDEAGVVPDTEILSRDDKVAALEDALPMLDREGIELAVDIPTRVFNDARQEAEDLAQLAAAAPLKDADDVDRWVRVELTQRLPLATTTPEVNEQIIRPIIVDALRPTITVDEAQSEQARAEAADSVEDVALVVQSRTPIVRAGEIVTDLQLQALRETGQDGTDPGQEFLRALLLSLILTSVIAVYLRAYRTQIWDTPKHLLLLASLLMTFTVTLVAINTVEVGGNERHFLIPVGAFAMLATILFDARVGVLLVVPMVALISYQVPGQLGIVPYAAVQGLLSIPLVGRLSANNHLRAAAWQSTLAYMLLAGAFTIVYSGTENLGAPLLYGVLNGILTAVLVNGLLPFLESTFGVLTSNRLRDFADRNHPLLVELSDKAPGTYQHSVSVASLASKACRRIGADPLLAEVMAMYHDIGKVTKPHFFVENQLGSGNPHDQLDNPRQSALIIQRHVTDGIQLATVHKLPVEIVDGIRTHHGTTVVAFFYRRARHIASDTGGPEPDEAFFRYKGVKPFTREQAVLMLSDCSEGAVRSAAQNSPQMSADLIREIVTGLIADRVDDDQLDESPLTFADLRTVEDTIISELVAVYHPRIPYPEDPEKTKAMVEEARRESEDEARAAEEAEAEDAQRGGAGQDDAGDVGRDAGGANGRTGGSRAVEVPPVPTLAQSSGDGPDPD